MKRKETFYCSKSKKAPYEEIFNSLTHGIGVVLSAIGFIVLIFKANLHPSSSLNIVSASVYGSSLLLLYMASTMYHACRSPKLKSILKTIDHICIYLLIAGTYTPYALGPLYGSLGWSLFSVVWGLSIVGIFFKVFRKKKTSFLSTLPYLLMGWLSIIAIIPLFRNLSSMGFIWLLAGGIFYSLGTIFYLWKSLPFHHCIWHLFVLSGSVCHYNSIAFHIISP